MDETMAAWNDAASQGLDRMQKASAKESTALSFRKSEDRCRFPT